MQNIVSTMWQRVLMLRKEADAENGVDHVVTRAVIALSSKAENRCCEVSFMW
jgi:hypothetical protein